MRIAIFIVLFCCSFFSLASSLPPEHESARLLLVIEEAVSHSEWSLADKNLSAMAELGIDLPTPFFFYNGLVHFKQTNFEKAQHSLSHYVVKAGAEGKFYYDALRLLTAVEGALNKQGDEKAQVGLGLGSSTLAATDTQEPLLINEHRDAYVQSLKALFLTDSPVQALEMQINSLLSAHPYTGSRLKKVQEKQGVKFQISTQDNIVTLQERNFQEGFPQLSAKKFEVSGLDPFVRFDCSSKDLACWLYHPANAHEKWLLVDYDELVASELSQAFTRLIQLLQQK